MQALAKNFIRFSSFYFINIIHFCYLFLQAICPKQMVGCRFADIGCEEKMERDSMEGHEDDIKLHFGKLHVWNEMFNVVQLYEI